VRLPPYPKYKPSRVEWLENIPEHWELSPLYTRYEIELGKMLDESRISGNHLVPYLRNVDVQWDKINTADLPEMDIRTDEYARYTLREGDLLVCEGGEVGRAAIFPRTHLVFGFQKALHRLRAISEKEVPRFLYYTLQWAARLGVFLAEGNPNTIPHLTGEKLRRYRFPKPPFYEQRTIADFLDAQTAKLEALVEKRRELIEKLKEKRDVLISHTVTRGLPPKAACAAGLNPNPKRKPSGIEWLGEIPEHWEVRRLRHISDGITVGVVVNPSSYVADEGVPFLLGGDVREFKIDITNCNFCSLEYSNGPLQKSRLSEKDLVVVRVGYPGVAAVIPPELEGANCASMMIVRKHSRYCSQWLAYVFNSQVGRDQIEIVQYGAAQKQFNISHAVDFTFPFPCIREQDAIADYLDRETNKIDRMVAKVEEALERLQEYRMALVTVAVTGKIDVRNVRHSVESQNPGLSIDPGHRPPPV